MVIGGFLFFVGAVFMYAGKFLIATILFFASAWSLWKTLKNKKASQTEAQTTSKAAPEKTETQIATTVKQEKIKPHEFNTFIAGVQYENSEGKSIQRIIKAYVQDNYDYNNFEDYTNKEIKEYNESIWEFDLEEYDTILFEDEPTNEFDPTAIKVIHEEMGHIGYIPKKDKQKLKNFLAKYPEHTVTLTLKGGRHKFVDIGDYGIGDEKVVTETNPYYFNITIEQHITTKQ